MMTDRGFGFTEIEHTADWALKVWAPDLNMLFAQAAEGMYWLMETSLEAVPRQNRILSIQGEDIESMLVSFLSELLYLGESEHLGFDHIQVLIVENHLTAHLIGAPIAEQKKEIKAVTYHNLSVQHTETGFEVTIVFDV